MLYDPKWEKVTKAEPTLSGFIAWLRTKNPHEEYDFTSSTDCAYVQFLKETSCVGNDYSCSSGGIPAQFLDIVHPPHGAGFFREIYRQYLGASYNACRGWTFGDALRRAHSAAPR